MERPAPHVEIYEETRNCERNVSKGSGGPVGEAEIQELRPNVGHRDTCPYMMYERSRTNRPNG